MKRVCLKESPSLDGYAFLNLQGDRGIFIHPDGSMYNPETKRMFWGGANVQGYISTSVFRKRYFVHRLLAMAFIPNPENKPMVNHKDLDRGNNDLSNLEWCDNSENVSHGYANNKERRFVQPGKSRPAKLSPDQVLEIVRLVQEGSIPKSEIARMFRVSGKTIYQILKGRVHRHITGFTKEDT